MKKFAKHILLIDDDEIANFLNEKVISKTECTEKITVIPSAKKSLRYLNTITIDEKPDLILLDINMPAMNGWEFIEELKKVNTSITDNISIIMLTTSFNPEDSIKAKKYPLINGFKIKPLTAKTIEEIYLAHFLKA